MMRKSERSKEGPLQKSPRADRAVLEPEDRKRAFVEGMGQATLIRGREGGGSL